jgi:protein phosphatase
MTTTRPSGRSEAPATRKPLDDEIDVYGVTHTGKVRPTNQDHFLIASLRKTVDLHRTSLPTAERLPIESERLAFLAMVADGVGGGASGESASRLAVETITDYVAQSMRCYYSGNANEGSRFQDELQEVAMRTHEAVLAEAGNDPDLQGMATTLTLWLGAWPWGYLLQVGDSRAYLFRDGRLTQLTRDQTMAQELVDQGVLEPSEAFATRWAHILSSSIGGRQTAPLVTRMRQDWNNVGLLCSDGLTKHVTDERIHERLATMTSAKQVCEALLQDALDDGGTDNVTILVGRTVRREDR